MKHVLKYVLIRNTERHWPWCELSINKRPADVLLCSAESQLVIAISLRYSQSCDTQRIKVIRKDIHSRISISVILKKAYKLVFQMKNLLTTWR